MVSLPAGGMKSLGEYLGYAGHQSTKIHAAFAAVEDEKFGPRKPEPRVTIRDHDAAEKIGPLDLNIKELSENSGKHLIDVIPDYAGALDVPAITALMKHNQYASLPDPIKPRRSVDVLYSMGLNLHEKADKTWVIIKWYIFEDKQTFSKIKDALICGSACQPAWTTPGFWVSQQATSLFWGELADGFHKLLILQLGILSSCLFGWLTPS